MADKAVSELIAAERITPTDLFVLEQDGTAKKLTGQVLLNWLTAAADGHGGIQSINKLSTSGLVDTYRIVLADTTTIDFTVTNGKGILGISKVETNGLVDTYSINYNDGTVTSFLVTNGAKGDKGDNTYIWIKYASQQPTASSHSFGDVPDNWIGIYYGPESTAPANWESYQWFQIKGAKGEPGTPATLLSYAVEYQVSDSGTVIPSDVWSSTVPVVAQGRYLWTRTTQYYNTGNPVVSYSVSRMGMDGSGTVVSVANVQPDINGNVSLTAQDVRALPENGGTLSGSLNMSGFAIENVGTPTTTSQAANKGYVDGKHNAFQVILLASAWQGASAPYTQVVSVIGMLDTDHPHYGVVYSGDVAAKMAQQDAFALIDDLDSTNGGATFTCFGDKPSIDLTIQMEVNR